MILMIINMYNVPYADGFWRHTCETDYVRLRFTVSAMSLGSPKVRIPAIVAR